MRMFSVNDSEVESGFINVYNIKQIDSRSLLDAYRKVPFRLIFLSLYCVPQNMFLKV